MAPARDGGPELMLLACGTEQRRRAAQARIGQLCAGVDFARFTGMLAEQRLLPLVGTRVLEAWPRGAPASFGAAVAQARDHAARDSALLEAVTADLLGRLERRRITAMPLKGPVLARALYGDPSLRASEDVDILVAPGDLAAAAKAVRSAGWTELAPVPHRGELPRLHRRLAAPRPWLPSVELHWRVHWNETSFSSSMLARSASPSGSPRRAAAADELAALLLFFARDGFAGLRLAADLAAWWDGRGRELAPGAMDELVARHRGIEACIGASAAVAKELVGLPIEAVFAAPVALDARARRAVRLANWSRRGSRDQVAANVALVDALLTPWRQLPALARRQLPTAEDGRPAGRAQAALHCAKLSVRWAIALARTCRRRSWAPLPRGATQLRPLTYSGASRVSRGGTRS